MSSTNATVVKVVKEAVLFSKAEFMTWSGKNVTLLLLLLLLFPLYSFP